MKWVTPFFERIVSMTFSIGGQRKERKMTSPWEEEGVYPSPQKNIEIKPPVFRKKEEDLKP